MKTITLVIIFSMQLCAGIGIGYSAAGSLPVELTSFTANQGSGTVDLSWVTATEVNNFGYEIERANSVKEAIWEKIGFISGHGNSISPNNYSFKDNKPLSGKSQYRLKQIDQDGVFKYSIAVEVAAVILKYDLAQNFPNPYNPSTLITYSIAAQSNVTIKIYNVLGKLITTLVNENKEAGSYTVNFNAAGISNGVYFYKIQAGNYAATKKMLLLK